MLGWCRRKSNKHNSFPAINAVAFRFFQFTTSERRSLMQYSVHKIRNHRFLSTNSHQVRRSIDDMVERFHYEGMLNQAEAVRHLSTLIMNHESWREHYEVDVQYSLLDFLLHMTHEPIQTMRRNRNRMHERLLAIKDALKTAPDTDEAEELPQPNLAETDIDWVALLSKDFITLPSKSYGSDSSLSVGAPKGHLLSGKAGYHLTSHD